MYYEMYIHYMYMYYINPYINMLMQMFENISIVLQMHIFNYHWLLIIILSDQKIKSQLQITCIIGHRINPLVIK